MLCSHKNNNNKSLQNYTYFKDYFLYVEFRSLERIHFHSNKYIIIKYI